MADDRGLGDHLRTYFPLRATKSHAWIVGIISVVLLLPLTIIALVNLEEKAGFSVNGVLTDNADTLVANGFAMTIGIGNTLLRAHKIGVDQIVRGPQFSWPEQWGPAIEKGISNHQLPAAAAKLNDGGALEFGKFTIDREGITAGTKTASWSQCEECRCQTVT